LIVFALVTELYLAAEAVFQGVYAFICPCGSAPRHFSQIAKVVFSDQAILVESFFYLFFDRANAPVLLRAAEIHTVVAHNHSYFLFLV
jgi:hypothetical protein